MNKDLISVIVPVYNVERYLCRCLDSLVEQTYDNLEIILVDDGSTDNCPAICDEYAKKDRRIIVVHKENGGLSSARNKGIEISHGRYIGFVDSDDWCESKFFEKLYDAIVKYKADVCSCSYWLSYANGKEIKKTKGNTLVYETQNEIMSNFIGGGYINNAISLKLYKREIFNNVKFDENIKFCEDALFCFEMSKFIKKYLYIPDVLYHYYQNNSGLVRDTRNINEDVLNVADKILSSETVKKHYILTQNAHKYRSCMLFMIYVKHLKNQDSSAVLRIRKRYAAQERKNIFKCKLSKIMVIRLLLMSYLPAISKVIEVNRK